MYDLISKPARLFTNRYFRIAFLMIADAAITTAALLVAFWLRFDFTEGIREISSYAYRFDMLPWLIAIRWLCGWGANTYRWSYSHSSIQEGMHLVYAVAIGTILFICVGHFFDIFPVSPPRSVYAMEAAMTLAGMAFIRFFPKYAFLLYRTYTADNKAEAAGKPTLIFGAGGNAELLARELVRTTGHGYELVGFIDDDNGKWGARIHGRKVFGGMNSLAGLIKQHDIKEILVAIPDFSGRPLRRLVDICEPDNIKFKIVPSFPSVFDSGNIKQLLEDIDPEALLDRKLVAFDNDKVHRLLTGKSVLVTGAAGSIGAELCRQTAKQGISELILFDLNENELYFLAAELHEQFPAIEIRLEIGSVRDRFRVDSIMRQYWPELVFHAAAHKHVPLMENSPCEALKNNVFGTYDVCRSSLEHGVESFTLVSTDKAVASANIMGASKSLAEFIVREMAKTGAMRCASVRFGNVLGSNGSLLQIIRKQITKGGPVTITHKDMTRYFMAIPEAVTLILMATALEEGDTYILDMGEPISIDRLVRQVVALSGLTPEKDISVRYTKPRPGEKLYEELCTGDEVLSPASFPRISVVTDRKTEDSRDLIAMLAEAREVAGKNDNEAARAFFMKWVPDYTPEQNIPESK